MPQEDKSLFLGHYFITKWRDRLVDSNYFSLAKQMRKQGIPLNIALLLLLGCTEREPT